MNYEITYDFIQLGLTENDTIYEIRFYHIIKNPDTGEEINRRLYVANLTEILLNMNITRDVLINAITKSFGVDQIKHMENLLIDDWNEKFNIGPLKKRYVNITL